MAATRSINRALRILRSRKAFAAAPISGWITIGLAGSHLLRVRAETSATLAKDSLALESHRERQNSMQWSQIVRRSSSAARAVSLSLSIAFSFLIAHGVAADQAAVLTAPLGTEVSGQI